MSKVLRVTLADGRVQDFDRETHRRVPPEYEGEVCIATPCEDVDGKSRTVFEGMPGMVLCVEVVDVEPEPLPICPKCRKGEMRPAGDDDGDVEFPICTVCGWDSLCAAGVTCSICEEDIRLCRHLPGQMYGKRGQPGAMAQCRAT